MVRKNKNKLRTPEQSDKLNINLNLRGYDVALYEAVKNRTDLNKSEVFREGLHVLGELVLPPQSFHRLHPKGRRKKLSDIIPPDRKPQLYTPFSNLQGNPKIHKPHPFCDLSASEQIDLWQYITGDSR